MSIQADLIPAPEAKPKRVRRASLPNVIRVESFDDLPVDRITANDAAKRISRSVPVLHDIAEKMRWTVWYLGNMAVYSQAEVDAYLAAKESRKSNPSPLLRALGSVELALRLGHKQKDIVHLAEAKRRMDQLALTYPEVFGGNQTLVHLGTLEESNISGFLDDLEETRLNGIEAIQTGDGLGAPC